MEAYYDEAGFYDYIHKLSRTPILKCDILALTLERFNQSRTADMKIHRFRIVAIGTTDRGTYACYRRYHGFASYRSTCESYRRSSTVYLLDLQEPFEKAYPAQSITILGRCSSTSTATFPLNSLWKSVNPIGCSDCHDPETMNLHISRPALIEAFQRQGNYEYNHKNRLHHNRLPYLPQ